MEMPPRASSRGSAPAARAEVDRRTREFHHILGLELQYELSGA
jgi:hypothetical protein